MPQKSPSEPTPESTVGSDVESTPESAVESTADLPDDLACYCGLGEVMDRLSRKYAMQVLCVVNATSPTRFRKLEELLPDASTSTLSARLDELVEADLLDRAQFDEIPPRVEYAMTDDGRELAARLQPVLEWAEERESAAKERESEAGERESEAEEREGGPDGGTGER